MEDPIQAGADAKRRETVLREARSLLRRADRFKATADGIDDEVVSRLASSVAEDLHRLVGHLVQLDRRRTPFGRRSR
jgi:hypothetical protein